MDGSQIAVIVAILVVVLLAVNAGRRGRSDDGGAYPWWTLGLFAVGSRTEEEAREARDDARLAGIDATSESSSPDDRDQAVDGAGADASDDSDGGGDTGGDGGDGGSDD